MSETEPAAPSRAAIARRLADRGRRADRARGRELPPVRRECRLRSNPGRPDPRGDARGRSRLEERPCLGRHPQSGRRRHRVGLPAIFILLAVGALIGTWAMSGTLVAMVYYALGMLSPSYFYLSACIVCALVATSIGSSWTVVATIGLGLMGVAAEPLPRDHRRSGDLGRLLRRQDVAAVRHREPSRRRRGLAAVRPHPRFADDLDTRAAAACLGFWLLGSPAEFDTSANQAALAARYEVSAWAFLPLLLVVVLSVLRAPPFSPFSPAPWPAA